MLAQQGRVVDAAAGARPGCACRRRGGSSRARVLASSADRPRQGGRNTKQLVRGRPWGWEAVLAPWLVSEC